MVLAADLREGMVIKIGDNLYKVLSAEYKSGTAQMSGVVHTKLRNISTHTFTEQRFHPEDRLEDVTLEPVMMEYLYHDETDYYFMHPETYEQFPFAKERLGNFVKFLVPGMKVKVELYNEVPVDIVPPKTVELKVTSTGAGVKGDHDAAYKSATLENGMEVMVPQFIKTGDIIRVDVETERYLDRVKEKE
ncbi:MAG: elongation factor P [candidate division WOR-3 bacterium]|nr:elongation factor P [candidate division WOR-3 bacterium]MCX7757744.1 elongation factor P [candidate division WOR-3 bacterium]MDW7987828.1 elongation factor P [candidate division WOR-3 bacterium]